MDKTYVKVAGQCRYIGVVGLLDRATCWPVAGPDSDGVGEFGERGLLHLARAPPGMLVACAAFAAHVWSFRRVRRSPGSGFRRR